MAVADIVLRRVAGWTTGSSHRVPPWTSAAEDVVTLDAAVPPAGRIVPRLPERHSVGHMTDGAAVRPMTLDEYDDWIVAETETYAADLARATGETPAEARRRAEGQLRRFLPAGALTEGVFLMRVLDGVGEPVGTLWVGPHPERAGIGWVYDVEIDEHRRGEGFGRVAMLAAERLCRAAGWTSLGLNVFGHNARARSLYDSLGYDVVSTTMTKPLTS